MLVSVGKCMLKCLKVVIRLCCSCAFSSAWFLSEKGGLLFLFRFFNSLKDRVFLPPVLCRNFISLPDPSRI